MTDPRSDTAALTKRLTRLDEALAVGGDRVDPAVATRVRGIGDQVRTRLALGVDHTVVALLGGTGSGKSSLFNEICGLEFAEVGVKRPTTSQPTACVWGGGGERLLDWLEVAEDRRIERESALDGDTEAPLRGLVLLDLPDHDSIEDAHREAVDRLLPMADLLIWVVDPQKYADDSLHSGYLRGLVGHEGAMLVVLNQVDTVPPEQREALAADVGRLLAADGLTGVEVRTTSARTGEGVAEMRDTLAEVVGRQSLAARRASAEITDAARLVQGEVGDAEPPADALDVTPVAVTLAHAAGLPALADAVAAVVRGSATTVPELVSVQEGAVALARSQWTDAVTARLPRRWVEAVRGALAPTDEIRSAADEALSRVAVVTRRSRLAVTLLVLAVVLGVGAVAAAGAGAWRTWGSGTGPEDVLRLGWPLAAGLAVLAVLCAWLAVRARRAAATRRAERVRRDGREALEGVARRCLAEPTTAVLAEHRRVRELAAGAREA
ncbi:GTPase [Cellulomonas sp. PS-H5]|uniref:GTPase n=1 Tax=Cellulomonas sp. PS-H5 TaxID=2820400 RepID=UPI001C4F6EC6|nr:GTPase [Cellulomonas sp. PS-H5]MBW0253642.1 50S ribosome-binding GTPase [Cellulomonas sp. PS-H5]